MNIKSGKYPVRILEIDKLFYPQIYLKSFWNTGWYFISTIHSVSDYEIIGQISKPPKAAYNESLEQCEAIFDKLRDRLSTSIIKIHNARLEKF